MVKRKKIGLIYNYDENWIAGAYYILNIIKALNILDDRLKPEILIFAKEKKDFLRIKQKTQYPYLGYWKILPKYSLFQKAVNRSSRYLFGRNIILKGPRNKILDVIYPNPTPGLFDRIDVAKKIFWIPDFQDRYLKDFFSPEEVFSREKSQEWIAENAGKIVFSSLDSMNDFSKFFPQSNSQKIVIPFAVSIDQIENETTIHDIRIKYDLNGDFLICPNQLWAHKNHKTVLYAIREIRDNWHNILVVFTGKESDYRLPDYPAELKELVKELSITDNVKFLGFIQKNELDSLLLAAKAIIQPSLFEGWSTVIEEAKSLNKFIFASDINIHKEQLYGYPNKCFFERVNPDSLCRAIIDKDNICVEAFDYQKEILIFARKFLEAIN